MSSALLKLLKSIPEVSQEDNALLADKNYLRKSSFLVNDALQRGFDVMHMPDGDIMVTEVKTITYKYLWDKKKGKFERASAGHRTKRKKHNTAN